MRHSSPRPSPRQATAAGALVLTAVLAAPLGFLGAGTAAAVPAPGPALSTSVSTTGVVSSTNVRAQTAEWALQTGSIDVTRNRLYVGVATSQSKLAQVDLDTGVATTIPLGGAYAASDAAVSPLDGTVYVSHNSWEQGVSVLDPAQAYTSASLPPLITSMPDNPQQLDVGNDGRVYALHSYEGTISVIGASTGPDRMNVVQNLAGLSSRDGDMAIDNARDRLYVVSPMYRTLTVIDTKAVPAAVLGEIMLAEEPVGVGVDTATGQVLVTSIVTNSVSWLAVAGDSRSVRVTRAEALAPLPAGANPTSVPRSPTVRPDGTTFVVTTVYWTTTPAIYSQVTVIPAVVSATDPISALQVGYGASSGILDPRAGGTLYVPNGSQGTVSEISDVTLSAFATSTEVGSAGSLRASLTRSDARPLAGTVTFTDASASVLGTVPISALGTAELPQGSQPVGDLAFTAAVTAPSNISLTTTGTFTTTKAASTTTLALETASVVEGASATATLDVTGTAGVPATGSYTVSTRAGTVLASGTLAGGKATATFSVPPAGTTPLVAHFDGDANYLASDSVAVDLVVTARTPESTHPSGSGLVGSTSSVSVSGFVPGEAVDVALHSDPVALGTIHTDGSGAGTLRFTIPAVPAGAHHIVAVGATSGRVSSIPFNVGAAVGPTPAPAPAPAPAPGATGAQIAANAAPGSLASTGTDAISPLWHSALALLVGAAALAIVGVRRRQVHQMKD